MELSKLCWWITGLCNEFCKYCFNSADDPTFLGEDLTLEDHLRILDNIIRLGTHQITWSGGEALLVAHAPKLIKHAKERGIYNKITTNGKLLTPKTIDEIGQYLDLAALSLDTLDDATNEALGRGAEHRKTIIDRMKHLRQAGVKVDVNTVVMRPNIADLDEMGAFLRENPIDGKWKLMTFFPVRGRALLNKPALEIADEEFLSEVTRLVEKYPDVNIQHMMNDQIQQQYPGVRPNGDFIVTRKSNDHNLGSMTRDFETVKEIIESF